ncbi:asparaginase [Aurantimonas sp. A2-1-M11]|uniref:asparaginase n=1 Tax=Aurantimonas sp. A2-1-M11 TaxID=3113712 RepID=UPI002F95A0D6
MYSSAGGKQIKVYALGGTIAMVPGPQGAVPGLTGEALIAAVDGLDQVATVDAETFSIVASPNITIGAVVDLSQRIRGDAAAGRWDGIVVTQGTDTIEETSFLLDLLLTDLNIPVIVTGAMRNPRLASPDGPGNILAAVRVASSIAAQQSALHLGVLVVINDTIHAASTVLKANSHRLDAFSSPASGPVGAVIEGRTLIYSLPNRQPILAAGRLLKGPLLEGPVPVALVSTSVGDTGWLLEAVADGRDEGHYRGLVLDAMGGGHLPERLVPSVAFIAERLPVVITSRTGNGSLLLDTYAYAGSETDLRDKGVISAGWLHKFKAAGLLELLLRAKASKAEIRSLFTEFN